MEVNYESKTTLKGKIVP